MNCDKMRFRSHPPAHKVFRPFEPQCDDGYAGDLCTHAIRICSIDFSSHYMAAEAHPQPAFNLRSFGKNPVGASVMEYQMELGCIRAERRHLYEEFMAEVPRVEELGFGSAWLEEHHGVENRYWTSLVMRLAVCLGDAWMLGHTENKKSLTRRGPIVRTRAGSANTLTQ